MAGVEQLAEPVLVVRSILTFPGGGDTLLVRRVFSSGHNKGLWEFPGGKVDLGENLAEANRREIKHETGFRVVPYGDFTYVDSRQIPDGPYKGRLYVILCGLAEVIGGTLELDPKEHFDHWHGPASEVSSWPDMTPESAAAWAALGHLLTRDLTNRDQGL